MPEGRAALVTGAARGIGAATVDVLVASGYRVMALDAGGDVRPAGVEYDLASREQLEALRREFNIDARYLPVMLIAVGRPAPGNWPRKPRLRVNEVLVDDARPGQVHALS